MNIFKSFHREKFINIPFNFRNLFFNVEEIFSQHIKEFSMHFIKLISILINKLTKCRIIKYFRSSQIIFKEDSSCAIKIDEFFSQQFLHPCKLVCESIGFYHWFYDLVSPKVEQFILANPIETKKHSWNNPKTDFKDATKLAFLLAGGEFERNKSLSCYIPDKIERTFRETTRTRFHLVRRKTSIINSARRIFLKNNLAGPKILNYSTLCQFINKYGDKFNEMHRKFLYMLAENLFYMEKQISEIERDIYKFLSMERFKNIHQILITIPGVGDMVSAVLISEIGDFKRFPQPNFLASYAGVVPRVFQSDKKLDMAKLLNRALFILDMLLLMPVGSLLEKIEK
jgi:Transposase and inactivated derivatives